MSDGTQACIEWAYINQSLLPPLTVEEAVLLGMGFWTVCIVAWGVKQLKDAFI
ncbi:MAG: hypothetical protein RR370_03155 [Synergistaceae bacterium]